MKKSELKQGMVVQLRDGDRYLVRDREGEIILSHHNGWLRLEEYSEDLKDDNYDELDIIKVYTTKAYMLDSVFDDEYLTEIWCRKKEVDWSKIPVWTKVQVRNSHSQGWKNRYFLRYATTKHGAIPLFEVAPFDSFVSITEGLERESYTQCRLHDSVDIKEEWMKESLH